MPEYIFEIDGFLYDEETGEAAAKPEYKGRLLRCKDCWHRRYIRAQHRHECDLLDRRVRKHDYCSWAEPKKEKGR